MSVLATVIALVTLGVQTTPPPVLPIFDLKTMPDPQNSVMRGRVKISAPWASNYDSSSFAVYSFTGDTTHLNPLGNWTKLNLTSLNPVTDPDGTHYMDFTANMPNGQKGTLWVQLTGSTPENMTSETSVVATQWGETPPPSAGGLPGVVIPITLDPTLWASRNPGGQDPPILAIFSTYEPNATPPTLNAFQWGGPVGIVPGPGATGDGRLWQIIPALNTRMRERPNNGGRTFVTDVMSIINSGYYMLTATEDINAYGGRWKQMSGVIRPIQGSD